MKSWKPLSATALVEVLEDTTDDRAVEVTESTYSVDTVYRLAREVDGRRNNPSDARDRKRKIAASRWPALGSVNRPFVLGLIAELRRVGCHCGGLPPGEKCATCLTARGLRGRVMLRWPYSGRKKR